MYHIKEDKRAKASVELICDGLKRCLKEKSFESVTISDIQRVSGVSRSTFYRNFDRIENVLALMCDRVFEEAFLSDYANISEAVFRTWFRHQELIETIVGIDRGDMLYASLRRCTSRMRSGLPESGRCGAAGLSCVHNRIVDDGHNDNLGRARQKGERGGA